MQHSVTDILNKVRLLQLRNRKYSTTQSGSGYNTAFLGRGMNFSEVREYQYGDDVRSIDWNVSARFMHPFVKLYEVERDMSVMVLLDVSSSTLFGTQTRSKHLLLAELFATIALSAVKNNDKVGAIFFAEDVLQVFLPKAGRANVLRILKSLLEINLNKHNQTNIASALTALSAICKQRTITFCISDMQCNTSYKSQLAFVANKHDLIGLHLYDQTEQTLPNIGLVRMRDLETNSVQLINTSNRAIREKYESSFEAFLNQTKQQYVSAGARYLAINTQADFMPQLQSFFKYVYV